MVQATVERSRYKDQEALTIKSPLLAAQIIPHIGSTMCSLCWLPSGLELLRQRPGERYRVGRYGSSFVAAERAGFDEMLPTIDACFCDQEPWRGTEMPDHGELWSIPWEHRVEQGLIALRVSGVRFPYELEKRVGFSAEGTLRIDYRLENRSAFPLPCLWAAHPDFALPADAELELPEGVTELVSVLGDEAAYGETVRWPVHHGRDLRSVRASGVSRFAKYYVKGRMPEGWCAVRFPGLGLEVKLRFPVEQVPYLALLPNEGGIDGVYELFVEPCSAPMDRPDLAMLVGAPCVLPARGVREWHLEIEVVQRP